MLPFAPRVMCTRSQGTRPGRMLRFTPRVMCRAGLFWVNFLQGYAWCRRHHVGWYSIRKPAAGGNYFELYHHKDGMGITFFDDGNAMGWET